MTKHSYILGLAIAFSIALSATRADSAGIAVAGAVNSSSAVTSSDPTAQNAVLLDTFKLSSDPDDSASFHRAAYAGAAIRLGPRVYSVKNIIIPKTLTRFLLRGVPGKSVIKRNGGSGGGFFAVNSANVDIDGVTFDMNKSSITANQWGLLLSAGLSGPGQDISITNSVFRNNSGSIGSCIAILSTGPANGGSFRIHGNDISGCSFNAVFLASVTNGTVTNNNVHDNQATAVRVTSYLTASATNKSTNVIVANNSIFNNDGNGVQAGGFGFPYVFDDLGAEDVTIDSNTFTDNSGYQIGLQADHSVATRNVLSESSAEKKQQGGIACNARWSSVRDNVLKYSGASWGIDCGGAQYGDITGNTITMDSGMAIGPGGTRDFIVRDNQLFLSGTAFGMLVMAVESDGNGTAFETIASDIRILDNDIRMDGANTRGIKVSDNAGGYGEALPVQIRRNRFEGLNGALDDYAIQYFASDSAVRIAGNSWNGSSRTLIDPDADGDVVFADVFDEIRGFSSKADVRSIHTRTMEAYKNGSRVMYAYPTSGGSGYTQSATISVSGGGCSGVAARPQINSGTLIGVSMTSLGSGCTSEPTFRIVDSAGSGAVITVQRLPKLPAEREIRYLPKGNLLQVTGGFVRLLNARPMRVRSVDLLAPPNQSGRSWGIKASEP